MSYKPITIIKKVSNGVDVRSVPTLTDVYSNTSDGDAVIIYPGTFDIGTGQVQLKDNVNWYFIGNPSISSSNINGTFYDNGVDVSLFMQGEATITNTNGDNKRFVLTGANSSVNSTLANIYEQGDHLAIDIVDGKKVWKQESLAELKNKLGIFPTYKIIQYFTGSSGAIQNYNTTEFINEIPNSTIESNWTKTDVGVFYKKINGNFSSNSFIGNIRTSGIIVDENVAEKKIGSYQAFISWDGSSWKLNLLTFDLNGDFSNLTFSSSPHTLNVGVTV